MARLGDVADLVSGVGFPVVFQGNETGDLPFIKVSDLRRPDGHVVTVATNYVSADVAARLHARVCPPGTVIFPKVGGALLTNRRAVLGTAAVFDNNLMGAIPTRVDPGWLFLWFCSVDLSRYANTQSLPSIRQSSVAALRIPLPSTGDQRRIAAELTEQLVTVDAARYGASRRIETVMSLRLRAYEVAFQDSVPFSVASPVGGPPPGWDWQTLTDLARLETGHTPSRSRPDWWTGDIPWIALPDIRRLDGKIASETVEATNADGIANSSARVLPVDTVVMSRTASVGFVTRMGRPMATSQDFVNWVCGPDLDPEFLMHLLIRSRDEVRALSSGAIHKTVYLPTVKAFRVCVPGIDEQRRIAAELRERLATIDAMEVSIRAEQEAIEALPAALLRRAFQDLAA
jgi:type I restriction enzyme S subunit